MSIITKVRSRLAKEEGFTLIELLVVILIIGILAAVAIPTFLSQRSKAYGANAKSDLKSAQTVVEAFANGNGGSYPVQSTASPLSTVFASTGSFADSDASSLSDVNYLTASNAGTSTSTDSYLLSATTQASPANTYYLDVVNGVAWYGSTLGGVSTAPTASTVPTTATGWSNTETTGWAS